MPERPNVLLLVLEDTTPRFGCYGDGLARTPNLDSLAAEGRRYPNTFSTAPVCAPSRASLMTGVHPPGLGAHHMRTDTRDGVSLPDAYEAVPPHYVTAFTEYLRGEGYHCALDSKTDYQFGEPFTMWDEHGDGADWGGAGEDQSFFCMLTNGVTHESGMWDPGEGQFGGSIAEPETDPESVPVPPSLPDTEPTRRAIARQYDNVAAADAWVGDVLAELDAAGHAEDTLVVVTSDHGEGLPRRKRWPYDGGTNVPLIVRWPGEIEGGTASDEMVSLVDLAPTFLDAAGVDAPQYIEGESLLGGNERAYAYSTRDRYDESYDTVRSVRGPRYRYVRHYYPERPYVQWIPYRNRHPAMRELFRLDAEGELTGAAADFMADRRPAEELYDTHADPHETENLAGDPEHGAALERMRAALDGWRERVGDREAAKESEAEMRERAWPDGEQPATEPPRFVPNAPGNRGRETTSGGAFEGPMTVSLYCATQGASLAYTTDSGDDPHWHIYDGPIRLEAGEELTLRAKAVRYGYAESEEREAAFAVE